MGVNAPAEFQFYKRPGGVGSPRVIILLMVSLLMLRHAKSDWRVEYGRDDLHRPLAKRGKRAARTIGRFLVVTGQGPERALVSPALRATQTVELAMTAGNWECQVVICDGLYGDVDDVLDAIRHLEAIHGCSWLSATSRPGRLQPRNWRTVLSSTCLQPRFSGSTSTRITGPQSEETGGSGGWLRLA